MNEIDWQFQVDGIPEILGPKILEKMNPGDKAELLGIDGSTLLERDDPRYHDGTPSKMLSFKLVNYAGRFVSGIPDKIQEAFESVARQGWVDNLDYMENGRGIRWYFFYRKGKENDRR